jgi:hypothetical protein
VTRHAADRWHARRKTSPGVGPKVAWEKAEPLPRTPTLECDAARYHEPTDLVLVAKRDVLGDGLCLVTAIRGDDATWRLQNVIAEVSE